MRRKLLNILLILAVLATAIPLEFMSMGVANAAGSLVATVTPSGGQEPVIDTFHRQSFYGNGRFWAFYSDKTNLVFKTSTDGATWSSPTTVRACTTSHYFSIWFDGTYVHYVSITAATTINTPVNYRRGLCNADGTITWSAAEQTAFAADANTGYAELSVSTDSSGYPWVACEEWHYTGTWHIAGPYVSKSSTNDGTWSATGGFPYEVKSINEMVGVALSPLLSNKMLVVWTESGSYIYMRQWNGSSWGSAIHTTSMSYSWDTFSTVADGDTAHIVFTVSTLIKHVAYTASTNSLGTETTIVTVDSGTHATLSLDGANHNLYCFWLGTSYYTCGVYYKKYNGASWDVSSTWWENEVADGFYTTENINSFYSATDTYLGVLYMTYTAWVSPYKVKFAYLEMGEPSPTPTPTPTSTPTPGTPPTVTTLWSAGINPTYCTLGGQLTSLGDYSPVYVNFRYGETTAYATGNTSEQTMTSTGGYYASITGLTPSTLYHYQPVARYDDTSYVYGADGNFTTPTYGNSTATTGIATILSDTSVTLSGTYALNDFSPVYAFMQWGTTTSYTGGNTSEYLATINGSYSPTLWEVLTPSTLYHYRMAVRYDSTSYAYGADGNFTTSSVGSPGVTTGIATNYTTTSITLQGELTSLGNYTPVFCYFEYGLTPSYGTSTAEQSKTSPIGFTQDISGLTPFTLYYFRAVVRYGGASYVYGNARQFWTLALGVCTVTTNSYTNLSYTSVLLQGEVTGMGGQTEVYVSFQYGINTSYGEQTPEQSITTTSIKIFSYNLTNLTSGTTYHYRAILRYGSRYVYGNDNPFTTLSLTTPIISTVAATSVTNISAVLNGSLDNTGGYSPIYVSFIYTIYSDWHSSTSTTPVPKYTTLPFVQPITGLLSGTTYYVKTKAIYGGGMIIYGNITTFLTLGVAPPTPPPAPTITPSSPCTLQPVYATGDVSRLEPITGNNTMIDIIGNDTYGIYGKVIAAQTFTTIAAAHDVSYIKIFGYIVPGETTTTTTSSTEGTSVTTEYPNPYESDTTSTSTSTTTAITSVTLQLRSTHSSAKYPWKSDLYNKNGVTSELTLPYTPGAYYNAFTTDTNGAWTEFKFTQSFQLEANTTYALVISAPTGIMDENFQWYWGNTSDGNISDCSYNVGKAWISTDGGKNWNEQIDMDFQFEVYGSAGLIFAPNYPVEIFRSYYQTNDWLITVACKNTSAPYYNNGGDVQKLFTIQLLEISTCSTIAKSVLRNWGASVASIYINPTQSAPLQWDRSADYVIRIQSTYSSNFYIDYLLTNADWAGDEMEELDTWCKIEAGWMGEQNQNNKRYYLTESSNGDLLNDNGIALFSTGIQQLGAIRGSTLFATFLSVVTPNPNSTPNHQLQSKYDYTVQLGPQLVGALTDAGVPFNLTPDAVGLIVVLALYVMVVGSAFPLGHGLAGTTAGLIIILIGMTAGLVQVTWVILAIIFAVAMMLRQMLLVGQ